MSSPCSKYNVFLSFRGDTRNGITDHLYLTLKDYKFNVFLDEDELTGGDPISDKLKQAIKESRLAAIMFSKGYAESRWCLEELVEIMECRRTRGQLVFPIFYDVDPSDVRHQTGSFATAFKNHKQKFNEGVVRSWRNVLKEAAELSGEHFRVTDGHEGTLIRKVVGHIARILKKACLNVARNPVGIDSRGSGQMSENRLLPNSTMSTPCSNYDVFLCFRGETRNGITDHLYCLLKDYNFNVFLDEDGLTGGDPISDKLKQAIKGSRLAAIMFSKGYAESRWCLEELVEIMECRRTLGQPVFPIFYDVDPSHVRHQTGSFQNAFQSHEQKFMEEKVRTWRYALHEAAALRGEYLQMTDGHEGTFIRKVVGHIARKLKEACLNVARNPVGIDSRGSGQMSENRLLPNSTMSTPCSNYDVFLCFRGETRKGITDHLYYLLKDYNFNVFLDEDGLTGGDPISDKLQQAIKGSRLAVIVFSKGYAESRWCLDQLVDIMECRRTLGQLVFPIFYDVNPSDIRHQTGSFQNAFQSHEQKFMEAKVRKWRNALNAAAELSGLDFRVTDGHEGTLIRKVVGHIARILKKACLNVATNPVGIDSRGSGQTSENRLLPNSTMSTPCSNYDVFLSIRGETRNGITDHLYCLLKDYNFNVFLDEDGLTGGDPISDKLKQAIKESRLAAIMFSKGYAESRWCLGELVEIMECRRTLGQLVFPIFYDVDPSDVRHQTGSFATAFKNHKQKFNEGVIRSWRNALKEAAELSGLDFRVTDGHEGTFIRKVVGQIARKLKKACLNVAIGISRHPNVKWAQRSDIVYITIDLPDAQDVKLKLEPEGKFLFSANAGPEKTPYEVDLDLYDKIDVNDTKSSVGLRNICYLVKKAEAKWWSRLIKQQGKAPIFLKVDWDKWVDEDEEPEEVKGDEGGPGGFGNNMDFGGLGNNMDFGGLGNNMNLGGLGNNMNFGDFDMSKLNMGGGGSSADALGKFDEDDCDTEDETADQPPSAAEESDAKPPASAEHDAKASV